MTEVIVEDDARPTVDADCERCGGSGYEVELRTDAYGFEANVVRRCRECRP